MRPIRSAGVHAGIVRRRRTKLPVVHSPRGGTSHDNCVPPCGKLNMGVSRPCGPRCRSEDRRSWRTRLTSLFWPGGGTSHEMACGHAAHQERRRSRRHRPPEADETPCRPFAAWRNVTHHCVPPCGKLNMGVSRPCGPRCRSEDRRSWRTRLTSLFWPGGGTSHEMACGHAAHQERRRSRRHRPPEADETPCRPFAAWRNVTHNCVPPCGKLNTGVSRPCGPRCRSEDRRSWRSWPSVSQLTWRWTDRNSRTFWKKA